MKFWILSLIFVSSLLVEFGHSARELARGKQTSASSLHHSSTGASWDSSKVVDGNNNTNIFCNSCLHTANGQSNAWWQVNLGDLYTINRVEIYSREPYKTTTCPSDKEENTPRRNQESDRFKGFSIFISHGSIWTLGERCYKEPSGSGEYPDLYQNNSCVGYGSYLTIYTDHRPITGDENGACLTICEVKVYGCENGTYGDNCTEECPQNCMNNTCDPDTGNCFECEDGWSGSTCQDPCAEYSYGRNCSEICGNCDDGVPCISTNGTCPNGCSEGWINDTCDQACPEYFFGIDCKRSCGKCRHNASCIHTNGTCPIGCEDGYTGDLCNMICPGGQFGYNCLGKCGSCRYDTTCHHVTGVCTMGCADGWLGINCNISCPLYTYGADCNSTCGLCRNNETCVNTDGTCTNGCADGYYGNLCKAECSEGKYGTDCAEECGHCRNASDCHHVNGTCMSGECQDGWLGSACNSSCPLYTYGADCNKTCGQCKNNEPCVNTNGACSNGCEDGYTGHLCKAELTDVSKITSTLVAAIAVGIAVLTLLVVIVSSVLFLRRRRQAKKDGIMKDPIYSNHRGTSICSSGESTEARYHFSAEEQDREITSSLDEAKQTGQSNQAYSSDLADTKVPDSETVYSNLLHVPREIKITDLKTVIDDKRAGNVFQKEFEELPSGHQHPHEFGKMPENKSKNRFISTFPYDHSLVRLREIDDDPNSVYINANYIGDVETSNAYIATQGPKRNTLDDFWRMIWETEAEIIVMLTNLVEVTRTKCFQYWPEKPQKMLNLEKNTVQLRTVKTCGSFIIRSLTITNKASDESRDIQQFHFTSWPDHGTPDPMHLVIFHHFFNSVTPRKLPVVVHCSAGIGRTGTFIALDALIKYGRKYGKIDVFKFVEKMRGNRMNMIQTMEQYIILHEALMEAFLLTGTAISKLEFSANWKESQREDVPINKRRSRIEFKLLTDARPKVERKSKEEALLRENNDKTRDLNHIPVSKYRPLFWSLGANHSTYINATVLPSLKNASAFITTQCPLPETAEDFWCMVYDQESSIVVVLEEREHTEDFFPTVSEKRYHGMFIVEASLHNTDLNGFSETEMSLVKQNDMLGAKRIKVLESSCWNQNDVVPTNAEQFLTLVQKTKKEQENQLRDGPVTVVCLNGTTKCGLFCAVHNILERIDETDEVDVASAVRQIQLRRPQAIPTIEEYEYCYSMVQAYFDTNAIYVNF